MEIYFILTGAAAGLLAGLFGIGGGLVTVPALFFMLPSFGIDNDLVMPLALGTSLAIITVTSISSGLSHYHQKAILMPVFFKLSPGLFLGALVAGGIAKFMGSQALTIFFVVFTFLAATQMLNATRINGVRALPSTANMIASGEIIGLMSGLAGIGGGLFTSPFLLWFKVPIKNAIATSAACAFPIASGGMLGFMFAGLQVKGLPAQTSGYIFWPAFLYISVVSVLFAHFGAKLAYRLRSKLLKQLFAIFLFIVGGKMVYQMLYY